MGIDGEIPIHRGELGGGLGGKVTGWFARKKGRDADCRLPIADRHSCPVSHFFFNFFWK